MNSLNQYVIALSVTSGTIFILSVFVYLKGRNKKINQTFALYSLSTAIWSGCEAYSISTTSQVNALLWWRINHIGVIFIPVFFVHFVFSLLGLNERKRRFIKIIYSIAFIALVFDSTPLLIREVVPKFYFNYFIEPGTFYVPFFLFWLSLAIYGVFVLGRAYLKSSGARRNQLKYLWWGTIIGYIGGAPNFLPTFNIEIPVLAPFGTYGIPIYVLMATYAIVAHRLMDIEVVVKKTLVFASLFAVAFGIFVGITVLTQELLAGGRLVGLAISSLIIIFSVRPLEDFLIKVTDKYLFQKKYNYAHIVNEFAEDLRVMALNTKDIAQSTVDFLEKTLRLNKAAIFIYNKFTGKYESIASYGLKEADTTFKSSDEIIKILKQSADIIELHKANAIKKSQEERLESLGVKLVVPLSIHKELLGVLLLGQKKSDEEYTKEDTEVLKGFSSTLTIALNNAQLFGERADAEKRALVGTLATGINHEIGNPLNIMSIKFESYKILKERGFYDGKSKEEIMKVFDDISIACSENIQRIGGIARQIAEFAKPDKSLTFTKVNIGETVDKITNVLKHGMIIGADKIVTKIVPSSLCVIVDRGQFEQVLFNLIKNACNAIDQDKGKIIIEGEQIGNEEIRIKVKDDGRGMPLSVRDKIFMPFFTTKEPGKGTGLGLTLTKIMVEKNDGKITVDSEDGKGTTFTIFLRGGI